MEEPNKPTTGYPGITESAENLFLANESLKAIQEGRAATEDHLRIERLVTEQRVKYWMANIKVDDPVIISQLPGFDFGYWTDGKTTNEFLEEARSDSLGDLAFKLLPEQPFNLHALARLCKRRLTEVGELPDPTWPYSLQFALWSINNHPSNDSAELRRGTDLIRTYVCALRDWPSQNIADGMTRSPMRNAASPCGESLEEEQLELIDLGLALIRNVCENFDHLPPDMRPVVTDATA